VRREYYDDKIKMQWKHHLSEGLHGPGGQKIPLYSNEFAATGKKIVDGTESSEEKKTSAVIYHSYGSMSKNSLVPERSIRIDYELINRLLGENKINDFDDLVKLGAVVDVSEGVARLTSFADLRKYLALSNSLNFSERKIIKKDADLFDSGTVDEQYLIQLVATENVEELRRMRFQKIGLSSKKGGPSLSFGSLFSGKKEFNSYSDCYKNITSLLNSLSIDLDSTGEDYISVQLDTLQGNHAVTAIIDIKKLKSLRSRGVNLNKTKEKFIYIYDTSRIVDDTSSEHRGNDLDGLMKNSEMFSQNQQAGGSCWFNAAASALAAAQNPSIVRDMADGKIKPYPKNINRLTEAPNALEVKQALTLQHIAELSEISKKLSGGLVADHVVNSSFRQNVFGYAEKEKILRRIETRLDSYAVLNGKEKKELKRQLEEKFATGWASPGRTDARVTADKFQESLRKLDMENELFRKLDKSLEQKQAVHLSSRVAALAKNMNTLDLAEVILAVKTLDRSIGVRKNLRVV
jgi:hypothetical protein